MAYQLMVGFDQATPEDQAAAAAIDEWRETLARDGWRATTEPVARTVRTKARTAVGEYAIEITGQRIRLDNTALPITPPGAGASDGPGYGD